MNTLEDIRQYLIEFAKQRDWAQFHSAKNLSMALCVETSELLEHFQWLQPDESDHLSDERLEAVASEIADVQMYLVLLANRLNIDILEAVNKKATVNEKRYPAERVYGKAAKYTQYQNPDE